MRKHEIIATCILSLAEYKRLYRGAVENLGRESIRKKAMSMASAMDAAVQMIVDALTTAGMLENSIIIFRYKLVHTPNMNELFIL